mmetsp:Transcript_49642/g.130911  ORF Transcript_49642/g.130911 Transcript_49642/m.130911 type:complete len:272 (+) Transcript_49642:465-1280(+)
MHAHAGRLAHGRPGPVVTSHGVQRGALSLQDPDEQPGLALVPPLLELGAELGERHHLELVARAGEGVNQHGHLHVSAGRANPTSDDRMKHTTPPIPHRLPGTMDDRIGHKIHRRQIQHRPAHPRCFPQLDHVLQQIVEVVRPRVPRHRVAPDQPRPVDRAQRSLFHRLHHDPLRDVLGVHVPPAHLAAATEPAVQHPHVPERGVLRQDPLRIHHVRRGQPVGGHEMEVFQLVLHRKLQQVHHPHHVVFFQVRVGFRVVHPGRDVEDVRHSV